MRYTCPSTIHGESQLIVAASLLCAVLADTAADGRRSKQVLCSTGGREMRSRTQSERTQRYAGLRLHSFRF